MRNQQVCIGLAIVLSDGVLKRWVLQNLLHFEQRTPEGDVMDHLLDVLWDLAEAQVHWIDGPSPRTGVAVGGEDMAEIGIVIGTTPNLHLLRIPNRIWDQL